MLWVVIAVNYDFTQSIVNMYVSAPFTNKVFQELSEQAKTIPFLTFLNKRLHWKKRTYRKNEPLDKIFRAFIIQQLPNHLRCIARIYLLHITFYVTEHVILVEVVSQIWYKTKTVTDIYQRPCIRKLGFHQEILRLFRIVEIRFPSNTFHFLDLPCLSSSFNVLEMYF
uniref:Uncharacterized protein n=1 Tax=Opuntia streptacantha TaxID=393608 RepID=A0A7C9CXQ7_OPUST